MGHFFTYAILAEGEEWGISSHMQFWPARQEGYRVRGQGSPPGRSSQEAGGHALPPETTPPRSSPIDSHVKKRKCWNGSETSPTPPKSAMANTFLGLIFL